MSVPLTLFVLARVAADLRTRLFRVEHNEVDARRALELYRGIIDGSHGGTAGDSVNCQAALKHASLTGDLTRDPTAFYRDLYVGRNFSKARPATLYSTSNCVRPRCLARPLTILAKLDLEVDQRRAQRLRALSVARERDPADAGRLETGASTGARSKIVSIEPYGSSDRARVVITLDRPAEYRVRELEGAGFVVEFDATDPGAQDLAVGGLVRRVRASRGSQAAGSARVVFELASKAYQRVFYLPEPFRVIVDVAAHPPVSSSPLRGAGRAVKRVALDAGHGGNDPGAIGPSGLREKDVTLDIAHLAAPVLSRELGILTLLTRDDDRVVALDERAARANAFHADLFVSIHCNASENSRAHGVMSFVLDTTPDEVAAPVAARENATSLLSTRNWRRLPVGRGASELGAQSTHLAELLAACEHVFPRFGDLRTHRDQGVKTAGFFVLLGAEMPSVLFETSFISNPAEEKRLGYRRSTGRSSPTPSSTPSAPTARAVDASLGAAAIASQAS